MKLGSLRVVTKRRLFNPTEVKTFFKSLFNHRLSFVELKKLSNCNQLNYLTEVIAIGHNSTVGFTAAFVILLVKRAPKTII